MKILINIIILICFLSIIVICQNQFYWKDAPTNGTKIYSIKFFDMNNGVAESKFEETLETNNSGKSWLPVATDRNENRTYQLFMVCRNLLFNYEDE